MNDTSAPAPDRAARPTTAVKAAPRRYSLAALRNMVSAWRERTRFRRELKQKLEDDPYLIDDIGLTRRQAEEEIARLPFWQR